MCMSVCVTAMIVVDLIWMLMMMMTAMAIIPGQRIHCLSVNVNSLNIVNNNNNNKNYIHNEILLTIITIIIASNNAHNITQLSILCLFSFANHLDPHLLFIPS